MSNTMTQEYIRRKASNLTLKITPDGDHQVIIGKDAKPYLEVRGFSKIKNDKVNAAIEYRISFDTSDLGDEIVFSPQDESLAQLFEDIADTPFVTYDHIPYNIYDLRLAIDRKDQEEKDEEKE